VGAEIGEHVDQSMRPIEDASDFRRIPRFNADPSRTVLIEIEAAQRAGFSSFDVETEKVDLLL
jgi:hypothetical protein